MITPKKAIEKFEKTQLTYSDTGAYDSEPRHYFEYLVSEASAGRFLEPDPEMFECFIHADEAKLRARSKIAEKALAKAAKKVIESIKEHGFYGTYIG